MKNIFKLVIIIVGLILILTMCDGMKLTQKDYEEIGKYSFGVRNKVDKFADLGNPDKYDKDRSLLRFVPIVFIGGGVYFIGQSLIRKWTGHDESEYYRAFWKEEPFGGFHHEVEDEMGRVAGSDREDGRGMLGYRSYGKEAKEKQAQMDYQEQQEIYQAQQVVQDNQPMQQDNQTIPQDNQTFGGEYNQQPQSSPRAPYDYNTQQNPTPMGYSDNYGSQQDNNRYTSENHNGIF